MKKMLYGVARIVFPDASHSCRFYALLPFPLAHMIVLAERFLNEHLTHDLDIDANYLEAIYKKHRMAVALPK
jgi:hypothetical protein